MLNAAAAAAQKPSSSMKPLVSVSWLLLIVGCCAIPDAHRPVAEFQRKHPAEFRKYTYLNPISLNTYKAVWGERAGATGYMLGEIHRRFGNVDGVKEFVKAMRQRESEDRQRILTFCRDLEEAGSNGGAVCQYEWSDGKSKETGFLVLKSGEVVKREPWLSDYLSQQREK
jgi:hypothetical protein